MNWNRTPLYKSRVVAKEKHEQLQQERDELLEALKWALTWIAPPARSDYADYADYSDAQRKWSDDLNVACMVRDKTEND